MRDFLNAYDRSVKKIAVLQNAFNINEIQELNKIYTLSFSLPADDPKTVYCQPFNYIRWREDGELYRIIKVDHSGSDTPIVTYECEHVIAALCDTVLFGSYAYGGGTIKTPQVIEWLLSQQKTKNWQLDECDFERRFEYCWEQENLLNALYAIPKEFSSTYKWVFDTTVYPWRLSLKLIDTKKNPEFYIRAKLNLIEMDTTETDSDICTRLYPLGYGEGVNQLTIKDVNNNIPYLQAPAELVAKYGLIEKILVDRRFESADSLKEYGQTILNGLQSPSYSRSFKVADLYPITSQSIDNAQVGKICRLTMDDSIVYITKTTRKLDEAGNLEIELSNKATDIASSIADLADRVRIESVYAQGATQLYQHSKDANATKDKGMEINLYFPQEMKMINKVLLKIQLESFRAYSSTTTTNDEITDTTEAGGMNGSTMSDPGGSVATDTGSTDITVAGTTHTHWEDADYTMHFKAQSTDEDGMIGYHHHYFEAWPVIPRDAFNHYHTLSIDAGSHTHDITIPSHSHGFSIEPHKHTFKIKAHKHDIKPGIFEYGNPSGFTIWIDGVKKKTYGDTYCEEDITKLLLNDQKQIPRDTWIKVEIRPNDLAYVVSSVFVQGFVQSRGGGNY